MNLQTSTLPLGEGDILHDFEPIPKVHKLSSIQRLRKHIHNLLICGNVPPLKHSDTSSPRASFYHVDLDLSTSSYNSGCHNESQLDPNSDLKVLQGVFVATLPLVLPYM